MKKLLLSALICLLFITAQAQCPISAGITFQNTPYGNALLRYEFTNTSSYGTFTNPMGAEIWIDFGDGSTSTGYAYTGYPGTFGHEYASPGTYSIIFASSDIDTMTGIVNCTDTFRTTLTTSYTSCATSMSVTSLGGTSYSFTATTPAGTSPIYYYWSFGDGTYGSGSPVTHTYAVDSTYIITLQAIDSVNMCFYTNDYLLNNTVPDSNMISGYVVADTFDMSAISNPQVRVWLITYDSTTQILSAVDSTDVFPAPDDAYTLYQFANEPAGVYRTKAHVINGPSTGTTFVPTYYDSSLYWNTASIITHYGTSTKGINIYMQKGTAVTGPGFIGGDITLGANRGTSAGVPNLLIFLRDANGELISSTYTDANGIYAFNNLPVGTYSVYPENGGYTTTAYSVMLTAGNPIKNSINFGYDENDKTIAPKTTSVEDVNNTGTFSIYPNPANSKVYINWKNTGGKADVIVSDIAGRKVIEKSFDTDKQGILDLNTLTPGQYFISVEAAETSGKQKLVIIR